LPGVDALISLLSGIPNIKTLRWSFRPFRLREHPCP